MTKRHTDDLRRRLDEARLYLVLGGESEHGRDPASVARAAVRGGVDMIQVRLKGVHRDAVADLCARVREACALWNPLIIVNDVPLTAHEAGADGVHLGQTDCSVREARELLGPGPLVGLSTHSVEQVVAAGGSGADYIGVGAMFPTRTKERAVVIGQEILAEVDRAATLPWFAIGGITIDNLDLLLEFGCRRVAVSSAIQKAADPEAAARTFKTALLG